MILHPAMVVIDAQISDTGIAEDDTEVPVTTVCGHLTVDIAVADVQGIIGRDHGHHRVMWLKLSIQPIIETLQMSEAMRY